MKRTMPEVPSLSLPTRPSASTGHWAFRALTCLVALALVIGCGVLPDGDVSEPESPIDLYVAVSGGGWRAHTAHAAWTIGLLDNQTTGPQQTLDQVFQNVSAVSSNSGGSWFNVMLSYSKDYRQFIESTNVSNTYTSDSAGYFLLEKTEIQGLPAPVECDPWDSWPQLYFTCILGEGVNAPLDWDALIQGIVFEPYSMASKLSGTTLGAGTRQGWASGKALLLAATVLTEKGVLAESDFGDKYFYSAPALAAINVAPVTFSSVSTGAVPPFFPSAPSSFDLKYSSNAFFPPHATAPDNHGDLSSAAIDVVTAAAASSAATGFVASHAIVENNNAFLSDVPLTDWQIAYEANELALYFNLPDPSSPTKEITRSSTRPTDDAHSNAAGRYVQIADGGPLDNSAVVQMVAYHQQNHGTSTPFTIVAFDSVQESVTPTVGSQTFAPVGIDIASLFGKGYTDLGNGKEGFCTAATASSKGFCLTVVDHNATPPVSPQIFDVQGIYVDSTWTYPIDAQHELVYTRYDVTTVASALMGVAGGSTGTLHAFTTKWANANTAPWTTSSGGKLGDVDWEAYAKMFEAIQTGLKAHGGLEHLRTALGLTP